VKKRGDVLLHFGKKKAFSFFEVEEDFSVMSGAAASAAPNSWHLDAESRNSLRPISESSQVCLLFMNQ
jgi:hypothetical protein